MYRAISTLNSHRSLRKFILHPLIHTSPPKTLAQDFEKKKSGAKDSAVFFEIGIRKEAEELITTGLS